MKQLFQNLRTGETVLVELPVPQLEEGKRNTSDRYETSAVAPFIYTLF